ncbi:hypothetical protein NA78x_001774 [Anatilimnocola sp. NA78]|uniref:hypothetical protein n=1 Tax=Anatilimnocola sp. NA78 TaxID=3415683 RepID=UPI003CE53B88
MQTLEVTNVGPVERLSIPVPEGGGIVVLRGRNGKGKSKTLETVEYAISGRGKLEVRDGQKHGEFTGFGVTITVQGRTSRKGKLVVESLEGRLSVAELVDPGIKDFEAADTKRIKALVQLSGVLPSAELFHYLVGGQEAFEKIVGAATLKSNDLVTMADRVKRDFHEAALVAEKAARDTETRASGARQAAEGIDINVETDAAELKSDNEDAIRAESELKAMAASAATARMAVQEAKDNLEDAEAGRTGPTIEEAKQRRQAADDAAKAAAQLVEDRAKAVAAAELALKKAKERKTAADTAKRAADDALESATTILSQVEQHEESVRVWREQLSATIPTDSGEDAIRAAADRVAATNKAIEDGVLARRARQHLAEAESYAADAKAHREQCDNLRKAADGTDEVLSSVVSKQSSLLRVELARLVLDTDRGVTYFSELSQGERWKLALDIAIDAVGKRGILMIPQEAFESLDPINRQLIKDHVHGRGVTILTAEASDDEEITAEVMA